MKISCSREKMKISCSREQDPQNMTECGCCNLFVKIPLTDNYLLANHNLLIKFVLCISAVKNSVTAVQKSSDRLKCKLKDTNFER